MCLSFTLHISIYPLHIFLSLHVVSISVHRVLIGQASKRAEIWLGSVGTFIKLTSCSWNFMFPIKQRLELDSRMSSAY